MLFVKSVFNVVYCVFWSQRRTIEPINHAPVSDSAPDAETVSEELLHPDAETKTSRSDGESSDSSDSEEEEEETKPGLEVSGEHL